MYYCKKCCVKIVGHKTCCPLCQGRLSGEPIPNVFPDIPARRVSFTLMTRIGSFAYATFMIVLGALLLIPGGPREILPLLAAAGTLVWVDFMAFMYYRGDIIKAVTIEIYLGMLICLVIDYLTKGGGWALSFVLPACFPVLVLVAVLLGVGQGLYLNEFLVYLATDILLSLLQIVPVLTGLNPRPVPAVICMALMLVLTAGMVIFRFRDLRTALEKLFNM